MIHADFSDNFRTSPQAPSKVAEQVKDEQDDQDQSKSPAAAGMSPVGIAAAAEEKNQDNNEKDEHHNDI